MAALVPLLTIAVDFHWRGNAHSKQQMTFAVYWKGDTPAGAIASAMRSYSENAKRVRTCSRTRPLHALYFSKELLALSKKGSGILSAEREHERAALRFALRALHFLSVVV
jgi:hypothetical protein